MTTVVLGVGNPYRHDDGVGPAVADHLRSMLLAGVTVVESDGEPSRLLDCWHGAALAVVVDAVRADGVQAGTVLRAEDLNESSARPPASSHGVGVSEAWALGEVLGRLPQRLVVYGIVGRRFDPGLGLSPAVTQAVEEVVAAIVDDVRRTVEPCA